MQHKHVKREVQPKWFTNNISQQKNTRDKSLKKARKSNLETDWNVYKTANTMLPFSLEMLNKTILKTSFLNTRTIQVSLIIWNLIKCLSKDGGENKSGISQVVENKVVISNSTSIAEIFNPYFIDIPIRNISPRLANIKDWQISPSKRVSILQFRPSMKTMY